MAININVTLKASKKVQRTDGQGNVKILYEVEVESEQGKAIQAVVFFPVARAMKYLKPNDKLYVGIMTHVHKWVNNIGEVDLVTENTLIFVNRIS